MDKLIVNEGKYKGKKIKLRDNITLIGSGASCDIRIRSSKVYRKHCQISRLGGKVVLHDLSHSDTTLVNGVPVSTAELHSGDEIKIHTVSFTVALENEGMPTAKNNAHAEESLEDDAQGEDIAPEPSASEDVRGLQEKRPVTDSLVSSIITSEKNATLRVIVSTLESAVPYFEGHSASVAELALMIACQAAVDEEELDAVYVAGLLHDFGQYFTDREVLLKAAALDLNERLIIEDHPEKISTQLNVDGFPEAVIQAIRTHHERLDGEGYPKGLRMEEIPLTGNSIALAEMYVGMTSPRPHRREKSKSEALSEIEKLSGKYFKPDLVKALFEVIRKNGAENVSTR